MKIFRTLIYLLLCVALVFTGLPVNSFAAVDSFTDMPNDWSREGLIKAIENGLLTGYNNKIMPKDYLTRAQMAAILNKAFGANSMTSLDMFKDMLASKWYYKDMAIAYKMGTFSGSGEYMKPENFITREEVFSVIAKALMLGEGNPDQLKVFKDYKDSSDWSTGFMASMTEMKYINGSNGNLLPKKFITRAEFAALMNNLFKHYIRVPGTYTGTYNGTVMVTSADVILKDVEIIGDLIIGDGVGDGEVTLENVTYTGRLIVRGNAIVVEADIEDEDVALGPGGIPGPPAGGTPGGGTPGGPGPGPGPDTPNSSYYEFQITKGAKSVLIGNIELKDNDKVNFNLVSDIFYQGIEQFKFAINNNGDFIDRALKLRSDRSGKPYALSLASRVINYENQNSLKAFNVPEIELILDEIYTSEDENATLANINSLAVELFGLKLKDIVNDLESIYGSEYVPDDFMFSYYNGSGLSPQPQLQFNQIESRFNDIYSEYTIQELLGKEILRMDFGDEFIILKVAYRVAITN